MILLIELIILCGLMFLLCYLGTGSDEKNVRSLRSYPDEVQAIVKSNPELQDKIKASSPAATFISNTLLFGVLLFVCGLFLNTDGFVGSFLRLLLLGELVNAFDFFVVDLLWWRHTKRVRFTGTENLTELYRDTKKHFVSFLKGILMFLEIAIIDGVVISLL
ncbi:MAG: hypothetical protein LUF29_06305 [Oscillospiraceae bacterium]|nr:hypothetical protein [Oscillospiraceae bacterium]